MDIPANHGRGPNVPDSVKTIIAEVYVKNPNQIAEEVMCEVHETLRCQDKQLRPGWPGLSYIQKTLTDIRKKESELHPDPLDRPWSLWDVMEPSIPGDALPTVLMLWADQLDYGKPITIREARWIAKLYYIFKDRGRDDMSFLLRVARDYALHEKSDKLLGEHPSKPEDMWFRWWIDALFYYPLFKDRRPLDIIQSGKLPKVRTLEEMEAEKEAL